MRLPLNLLIHRAVRLHYAYGEYGAGQRTKSFLSASQLRQGVNKWSSGGKHFQLARSVYNHNDTDAMPLTVLSEADTGGYED